MLQECIFVCLLYRAQPELHILPPSAPTRRSSDRGPMDGVAPCPDLGMAFPRRPSRERAFAPMGGGGGLESGDAAACRVVPPRPPRGDRKSTRLNSSHSCATRMPSSA